MMQNVSVCKMPPAREDGPIDYERRAQRMIQRWAGVRGPIRSDEERNNVTEIFTDRLSETQEQSFILGKNSSSKILNRTKINLFRESQAGASLGPVSDFGGRRRPERIECSYQCSSRRCRCGFMRKIRMFWRCDYHRGHGNDRLVSI